MIQDITKQQLAATLAETKQLRRGTALLTLTADSIPSLLKASEEKPKTVADIFTKCQVSQVLRSVAVLPNEDAFVAEMSQAMDKQEVTIHVGRTEAVHYPFLRQQLQAIERVARSRGQRMNKLFHDPANEQAIAKSDYTCTGPNENIPCFFNTLFYVQAKLESREEDDDDDTSLREGVARVVARITDRKAAMSTLAQFGLGVVSDGKRIVFVRMDLEDGTDLPVYVSEALPVAEGLRYLARMMCCSSAEQFGLPSRNMFELLQQQQQDQKHKFPFSYHYVRALGSGGFANVAVVREEEAEAGGGQRELVCKLVHEGADSSVLAHEALILGKLQTIATGVPRMVYYYDGGNGGKESCVVDDDTNDHDEEEKHKQKQNKQRKSWLLTSPVGTPLLEHMKSLRGEGERHSFARRVFEQLKAVLSAVHAKGIIHGDIKPDNIVVVAPANGGDVDVSRRLGLCHGAAGRRDRRAATKPAEGKARLVGVSRADSLHVHGAAPLGAAASPARRRAGSAAHLCGHPRVAPRTGSLASREP